MTKLYLIRHAEAEGNLYRIMHGHYDSLVTERGYLQLAALRDRFADVPIDAVYSSDLFRARTTARALSEPKKLPIQLEPALRELNMGVCENMSWSLVNRDYPAALDAMDYHIERWNVQDAERPQDVIDRGMAVLSRIARENQGKTVAVCTHSIFLRILLGTIQGLSLEEINHTQSSDNTAVSLLEAENGVLRVIYRDDSTHLIARGLEKHHYAKLNEGVFYEEITPPHPFCTKLCPAEHFDAEGLWLCGRISGEPAVLMQLMPPEGGAGTIGWLYVSPDYRGHHLGIQALGRIVQHYRVLGVDRLRFSCGNAEIRTFFQKYGFYPLKGSQMEKSIGYEDRQF